jgi:hypothetical protein
MALGSGSFYTNNVDISGNYGDPNLFNNSASVSLGASLADIAIVFT